MSLKYLYLALFCVSFTVHTRRPLTIMLDPAGDAQNAGRKINDYVERGITLQCAEQLKKAIETANSGVRVILTRFPGETIQPLQNASFANRLDVDLYVSIHFFAKKKGKHSLALFYFCTNSVIDYWKSNVPDLFFMKAHKVHVGSISTSKKWGEQCYSKLADYKEHFTCTAPLGIPFKPLCGIKAPAIGIEASVQNPNDWNRYIKPISEGITSVIELAKKGKRSHGLFS
jgi:N-acetylmuramoyl-L-alanine amidase